MQQLMQHPMVVGIVNASLVAIPTILIFLWKLRGTATQKICDRIDALEEDKREIEDCKNFRKRIGAESDGHRDSYQKIREALIFLVSKLGGDPGDLGLMR